MYLNSYTMYTWRVVEVLFVSFRYFFLQHTMPMIHVRVPADLKKIAQQVAEANGLDLSSCIRMFLKHMKVRGTIPLSPLTVNGFTEEEEEEILRRAREPSKKVKNAKELLRKAEL